MKPYEDIIMSFVLSLSLLYLGVRWLFDADRFTDGIKVANNFSLEDKSDKIFLRILCGVAGAFALIGAGTLLNKIITIEIPHILKPMEVKIITINNGLFYLTGAIFYFWFSLRIIFVYLGKPMSKQVELILYPASIVGKKITNYFFLFILTLLETIAILWTIKCVKYLLNH